MTYSGSPAGRQGMQRPLLQSLPGMQWPGLRQLHARPGSKGHRRRPEL